MQTYLLFEQNTLNTVLTPSSKPAYITPQLKKVVLPPCQMQNSVQNMADQIKIINMTNHYPSTVALSTKLFLNIKLKIESSTTISVEIPNLILRNKIGPLNHMVVVLSTKLWSYIKLYHQIHNYKIIQSCRTPEIKLAMISVLPTQLCSNVDSGVVMSNEIVTRNRNVISCHDMVLKCSAMEGSYEIA